MKIVLASRNRKKIGELKTLLSESFPALEVLSLDDVGIHGEIEENGNTFEENALIKARVAASSGYIGVGDDSGLTVEYLGGEPGIYSARYAAIKRFGLPLFAFREDQAGKQQSEDQRDAQDLCDSLHVRTPYPFILRELTVLPQASCSWGRPAPDACMR